MNAVLLCDAGGSTDALPVDRWTGPADDVDLEVLDRVVGPALDIGCGPGRHVLALSERGVPALGIDAAPTAVALARERGCVAIERSVFGHVPAHGRWRTILLLDGNIGIGGEPARLLGRSLELLSPGGSVLVESDPPATGFVQGRVRLEVDGTVSPWFPWARIGADRLASIALEQGFTQAHRWSTQGRWFLHLRTAER